MDQNWTNIKCESIILLTLLSKLQVRIDIHTSLQDEWFSLSTLTQSKMTKSDTDRIRLILVRQ